MPIKIDVTDKNLAEIINILKEHGCPPENALLYKEKDPKRKWGCFDLADVIIYLEMRL